MVIIINTRLRSKQKIKYPPTPAPPTINRALIDGRKRSSVFDKHHFKVCQGKMVMRAWLFHSLYHLVLGGPPPAPKTEEKK